jgi:hypothetical protein
MSSPVACGNTPCPNRVTCAYVTEDGLLFYLCDLCAEAFGLGQVNHEADLYDLDAVATAIEEFWENDDRDVLFLADYDDKEDEDAGV